MTTEELQRLGSLRAERAKLHERWAELRATKEQLYSPLLDGMPKGGGIGRRAEKVAARLVDLEAEIQQHDVEIIKAEIELQRFISTVPDPRIRLILRHRFIDDLSWGGVARMISRTETIGAVKMSFRRFMATEEENATDPVCGSVSPPPGT